MAKTRTPFFSLGAHGSVGGSVTAQKRYSETLVREKPLPTDPYSLPQAYQRWLYEDYAYLWRQQSAATQAEYRARGSRYHLTGFQYWMKYQLTNLPDIAAMWYLDEKIGATAHDYSRNANNGVIFGASPIDGLIAGAQHFDGINDRITAPPTSSLVFGGHTITVMGFFYLDGYDNTNKLAAQRTAEVGSNWQFIARLDTTLWFTYWVIGVQTQLKSTAAYPITRWCHLAFTYDGTNGIFYVNGHQLGLPRPGVGDIDVNPAFTYIGDDGYAAYLPGDADHVIIHNRVLDPTEILRHSERRYPAQ